MTVRATPRASLPGPNRAGLNPPGSNRAGSNRAGARLPGSSAPRASLTRASAPGASLTRANQPRRAGQAGVTLVEILVVLSIIAITTGAAMLRLGVGRDGDPLSAAATGLALALTAASDAALAGGTDRRLQIGPQGYRIASAASAGNTANAADAASAADAANAADAASAAPWHPLAGLTATVDPVTAAGRLAADGSAAPFQIRLAAGGRSLLVRFDGLRARVEAGS